MRVRLVDENEKTINIFLLNCCPANIVYWIELSKDDRPLHGKRTDRYGE